MQGLCHLVLAIFETVADSKLIRSGEKMDIRVWSAEYTRSTPFQWISKTSNSVLSMRMIQPRLRPYPSRQSRLSWAITRGINSSDILGKRSIAIDRNDRSSIAIDKISKFDRIVDLDWLNKMQSIAIDRNDRDLPNCAMFATLIAVMSRTRLAARVMTINSR